MCHNLGVKNTRPFSDRDLLIEAVNLRINGWALSSLALLYTVDKSSLRGQFKKYRVRPKTDVYIVERIVMKPISQQAFEMNKWKIVDGEKVSRGKTYEDYMREPQNKGESYRYMTIGM